MSLLRVLQMDNRSDHKPRGWVAGVFLLLVLGNAGCGKKYKASLTDAEYRRILARTKPVPPDTLLVNSEEITAEEIVSSPVDFGGRYIPLDRYLSPVAKSTDPNEFKELARPRIESTLANRIDSIILYRKAKIEAGGDKIEEAIEKMGEREWREYVTVDHKGNEAEAEKALQEAGITREQFKESRMRWTLSQFHVNKQVPIDRPISHGELIAYYEKMRDEFFAIKPKITFRLIDIHPDRLVVDDTAGSRREQALSLARNLLDQVKAGADFAELAQQHSQGFARDAGGLWKARDPQALAPPYDVLGPASETLEPGQVAGPIEARGHVFLLKLEAKQAAGYHSLAEVQPKLEAAIIRDRRLQANERLNAELKERSAAGQTDQFVDVCADEIYHKESDELASPEE